MPPAPFPRRALIEELEPRLLFSADFAPGVADVLSPQTEQRLIGSDGEFANATDSQQAQHARLEVVFIDLRVQDYDKILADIHEQNTDGHSIEIVLLDSERDGVAQIGEFLSQRQDIDAIHLISHGTAGSVQLGSGELNFDSLLSNAATIKQWGNALSAEADILIYGCDLASTESGQSLINALGKLTGADVAASDDKTGAAEQGGDWVLEYKTGTIQTGLVLSTAMQQNWENVLAITANGTASSTQTTNATSLTWSHTVASGTDRLLVVELAIDGLGAGVSSVTYGGVAMTQIGRGTGNHAVEIWGLVNPTVGTANIVVSFGGTTAAAGGATSFNGVNQSTPFGTFVSATGTGTAASVTVASATGDLVIDAQYWKLNTANVNGAGQTTQWSQANASMLGGSTTETGAASVTMSGSSASSSQWEIGAVSIKAATTPAGITVSPISGLVTTESGGTAQFSVVLDRAPTANVTIGLSSSDITEGTLSASSLTFTTANWSTPQTVTITGVDDTLDDGDIAYTIVTAAATSADTSYNGLNAADISVANTDNDTYNTIVVDTTNDTLDGNTTSISALISNKGADGKISLREAITAANNTANGAGGADRIAFSIAGTGVHTITLSSLLPTISQAVVIDATTDDSYAANGNRPAIVINGNNTVQDGFQLYTNSSGTTIRGFVIQNFTQDGIDISGSNGNTIAGNWIGLNSAGTGAAGNQQGINLWNSNNNIIGGSAAADRNVISANSGPGISINTNNGTSTGNQIRGNYIGTNAAGTAAVGNGNQGVFINAANNVVGGTVTGYGNVISGTVNWAGIGLDTQASGTLVAGNLIGLNAAGTAALANNGGGITVLSANNTIGGVTAETRNVISGNNSRGIYIYGAAATGNVVIGNYIGTNAAGTGDVNGTLQVNGNSGVVIDGGASNNRIGTNADGSNDVAERNLISGNNWYGVEMIGAGTTGNVVQGNFIGTDVTGLTALGNSNGGVSFWGGSGNTLGSGLSGAGNVISGNDTGVLVANAATNNKVQGNIIGLGADGSTVVGNTGDGVYFYNGGNASLVTGNIIGTDADGSNDAGERNVISGNYSGVAMENTEVTGNTVAGNYIGTDATGTLDRGNTHSGVYADSNGNTFGGDTPAERNLISGNNGYGFYVAGSNNVITGNWIGLDSTGNVGMGNTWNGVYLGGGTNNRVGGTAAGEGNVISGHGDIAVRLEGGSGHIIQGNLIGTNHDGSALIGNLVGFSARFGATNVLFGGTAAGAGNVVAGNGHGVLIDDNTTSNIAVLGNRIYSNTNLGIDLGSNGVTANDALDTDTGANNLQNFPVLAAAGTDGSKLSVVGSINSTANTALRLEFFANATGDASGYGEGQTYLGYATVVTDGSGNSNFVVSFSKVVTAGQAISATATVMNANGTFGSTSEFSLNVSATSALIVDTTNDVVDGSTTSIANLLASKGADGKISLREAIIATNNTAGQDTIFLPAGTYALTRTGASENLASTGDLDILQSLSLIGAGASSTTVNATGLNDRVFEVSGTGTSAYLSGITVTGGTISNGSGILTNSNTSLTLWDSVIANNTTGTTGGGLYASGTTFINNVTVSGNVGASGAGIYSNNTLVISNSTISANTASNQGGGIWSSGANADLSLINTTISGNTSGNQGGGLYNGNLASLMNVTIAGNTAAQGGGINRGTGTVTTTLLNTIVAGNTATGGTGPDVSGAITSSGNNIIGNTTSSSGWVASDQQNVNPLLGTLQDNGGPTLTRALLAGSPAINTGSATGAPVIDQRGYLRDATVDIGAYEYNGTDPSPNTAPVITSNGGGATASVSVAENTPAVTTVTSSDIDGGTAVYSISGGTDAAKFSINSSTGVLSFVAAPDYETPTDAGADNVYDVTVQVSDGNGGTDTQAIAVTVSNQALTTVSASGSATSAAGGVYTLNLNADEDATSWTINWGDGTIETIAGDPTTATHTYAAANAGLTFNIMVSATDAAGTHFGNGLIAPTAFLTGEGLYRYSGQTGTFTQFFSGGELTNPYAVIVGPDGLIYAAGHTSDNIVRYNAATGAYVDTFVAAGSGGLNAATGLAFGPDGHLYVSNQIGDSILKFNGTTGAFMSAFVSAGSGGLNAPVALTFRPDGYLYVSSYNTNSILRYNATTGAFVGTFVAAGSGGLVGPAGMAWGADGNLYVASNDATVKRYNGTTGAFINNFVTTGSGGLGEAVGLAFGPDGNLYVSSYSTDKIIRYNGTTGALIGDYVTTGSGGLDGPTGFTFLPSHQVRVVSTNVSPVLDSSKSPTLASVNEDASAPVGAVGTLVSSLVDFASPAGQVDNVTDSNVGAQLGIAVTAADTGNGTWYFSTNGGTNWSALGAVSEASARLLAADANTRLYFQPNADWNGTITNAITFRAWDQTSGSNGGTADTSTNGGTTAFSAATDMASLTVSAVNDAPSLIASAPLNGIAEDDVNNSGTLVSQLIATSISDVDAGPLKGIAITSVDNTNGSWQYTLNGTTWLSVGSPSTSAALLLPSDATTAIRYVPNANYNGTSGLLYYKAWDQTTGLAGGTHDVTVSGGTTAFSSTANGTSVGVAAVNDAPVNTLASAGASVPEDSVVQLLNVLSIADVDAGVGSFTVTLSVTPAAGTLSAASGSGVMVSGSGTSTLVLTGSLASINAYFASAATAPVFTAVADYNGAVSLTAVTNDNGNTGSGSALTDSDTSGGTILAVADIADDSVTTNEDTPVSFAPLSNDSFEDAGRTITHINGTAIATGGSLAVTGGTVTLNADSTLTFTPTANYNGAPSFTYTVTSGGVTETASVSVTVNPSNDAPIAADDRLALEFDGVDDYVSIADSASLQMTSTMTMEAWVNPDVSGNAVQIILNKEGEYEMAIFADGSLNFAFAEGGVWSWHDTGVDIARHTWTHIAISYDTGVVTTYINGAFVDSQTLTASVIDDVYPAMNELRIGGRTNSPAGQYFEGQIADVRVWNVARSQAEISAAMNTQLTGSDAGLAGYWMLDDKTGTTAVDMTANVNHGTLVNGAARAGYRVLEDGSLNVPAPGVLGNDYDADDDALSAIKVSDPAHGLLVLNADGSFTYTPDADWHGTDSFTYKINDSSQDSNVATVYITVDPVQDAPDVAPVDLGNVNEDDSQLITQAMLLAGASDADGDSLTAINLTLTAGSGTLSDNGNGTWTFAPAADWNGAVSFSFDVSDGITATANTASLAVNPINDAPIAFDESASGNEDTDISDNVLANDADVDNASLTASLVSGPAHGTLVLSADGSFTYTPDADWHGSDSFTYSANDGVLDSNVATVYITVDPVQDDPTVANPISDQSATEDASFSFQFAANTFNDADTGDTLTYTVTGLPAWLSFDAATRTFSGTPANGDVGVYTLTVRATDGSGAFVEDQFDVTVMNANDAPVLSPIGNQSINEGATLTFTATASDADVPANTLTFSLGGAPVGATIDAATGVFNWTPTEAQGAGIYSFDVIVSDGAGGADSETITCTVHEVNSAPAGTDRTVTTLEDTPYIFTAADFGFTDPGDVPVNLLLAVKITTLPGAGSLTLNGIAVTAGQTISVADISAGWLVFEPAADANGLGYASLTFQVQDDGGTANGGVDLDPTPNMITLNVTAVNDAPTVTPINLGAIDEDGSLLITQALLLSGTNDVDLDSLTAINLTLTAGSGTFTDNGDGTWTFTPDTDWSGSANFSFDVYDGTDSTPNTASLVVNPVNDEPATSPVMLAPISEDSGPRIITQAELLSNASDVDGPALTAINLSITSGTGTLTDNGDGTWTYTPASNDDTSVTFSYVVTDGSLTTSGSAALDITPVNDAPTAGDISFATDEDNVYSGTLPAASDIDSALITYALDVDATHGNVLLNSDGSFSYTPDSNYFGADNFSYTVSDGAGGSNTYTVTITVNPVNDAPTIVAPVDLGALNEDGSLVITQAMLLAGSSDIENNPLTAINLILTAGNGTLTDNGNGTWTFIPTADWNGAVSFGFDITDGMDSTSNTADLVVNPVNDAPLAVDNAFSGNEDNDIGGNVLANDSDVDNASLTATLVAGPAHGTLVLNADGSFTYTPDANWHGGDSFTYVANDGALDSNVATVNLTVNPVNDAPTVAPIDLGAISEDGSLLITQATLLSGANDVDGDSLTAISLTLTAGSGTLTDNGDGSWTFTPDADWNGSAGFSFAVDDGTTITANTASLTVNPVNDAPTVAPIDLGAISEDGSLLITQAMLLSGANDVDGDSLTAISLTLTAGSGTLTDNGDGSWTFTPDADWSGSAGFSFAVDDGTTTTANTASLTVDPVNDAPVITSNVLNIVEGGTVVLSNTDLSVADVEQSAAQLTFTISNVTHGQFEWAAVPGAAITSFTQADIDAGLVVFVHDASDMAPSYDVSVSDGTTTTGPQAATITFTPVDEGINVTALSGMSTTEAGGAVTFDVALNSQPIADVTVFIASGNPAEGTASVSSLTFTSANWSIAQQITVTGVDDFVDDGDQNYTIQIDANSTDRNYHLLAAPGVALTSLDDDTAGILITPASGLVTDESGASDTFSVVLTSQPLANVIIDLSSSNPAEGTLSTSSLTFTPGNWNIPQVVAVTGVNDIPDDGDIAYQAVAAPASSADANYNGLAAGAVDLTNRDVAEPVVVDTPPIEPAPEPDPQTPPGEEAGAPQSPEDSSPSVTESGLAPVLQGQPIDESGFAVETAPESQSETALNAGLKSGAPLSVNNESVRHDVLTNPESQGGVLLRLLEIIQADFTLGEDGGNRISPAIQVDIVQDEQFRVDILSQGAQITAVSLSVGAVWWALRAGGLFASLLTSLPAWRSFDVLPVLSRDEDDDDASWSFGDEPEDDDNKDDTRMPELTP